MYVCMYAIGTLPGIFIMESMIDHVARSQGLNVEGVKQANLYKQGMVTPRGYPLKYCNISAVWDRMFFYMHVHIIMSLLCFVFPLELYKSADVESRKSQVDAYNKVSKYITYFQDEIH